mgnify:CR=1 FL=1
MPILNSIVSWMNFKRDYQINLFKEHPHDVQRDVLLDLLDKAKNTEWGLQYGFGDIRTVRQFQERLPVQRYSDIKPYVEKLMKGEKNLLWPGTIKWFARSSGTTSEKSKFIPVSNESLEGVHIRGGRDVLAIYLKNYPESKILTGKTLTLGGSHQINNFNNNSYYGDLSAIIIENIPFWTEFLRTPSTEISLIEEFEEKIEKIIEHSLKEKVTGFAGVPSWYLVLLKRVLEVTGKNNILEVWPDIEVFTHGGVNFEPYRQQYEKIIPKKDMHYMETYNASEGFFAIQDEPEKKDMLLMLDYGIFYEFIPMDEYNSENPTVLSLDEVETETNYAIVITTNGGLWRYVIGDTVKFTSKYPYKIEITGRTKQFINAFGEEVIVDNAEKAIDTACTRTNSIIREYTAGPVFMGDNQKGSHEWIIEFEKEPEDMDYFVSVLDHTLQTLNSDYEAKRHRNITLDRPKVVVARPGLFYQWMKNRGKTGGQNKIPRLSNDRRYLDELLELQKIM